MWESATAGSPCCCSKQRSISRKLRNGTTDRSSGTGTTVSGPGRAGTDTASSTLGSTKSVPRGVAEGASTSGSAFFIAIVAAAAASMSSDSRLSFLDANLAVRSTSSLSASVFSAWSACNNSYSFNNLRKAERAAAPSERASCKSLRSMSTSSADDAIASRAWSRSIARSWALDNARISEFSATMQAISLPRNLSSSARSRCSTCWNLLLAAVPPRAKVAHSYSSSKVRVCHWSDSRRISSFSSSNASAC
mmetsp:Transcript_109270/g.308295  ORF Transcript_109270/g.308295 Transcript_109270/m.308295 type:complete len:250 (-) Transcript_109270:499-1248(-)